MISIALRNLLSEKTRFLISVGGVAFSVMLILIILSLYQGWRVKSSEYIQNVDTDLWVSQTGSTDLLNSASILAPSIGEEIKNISGVKEVNRFIGRPVSYSLKGKDVNSFIVGYDTDKGIGGPQKIIAGHASPKEDQIVVDRVLARNHNLGVGDFIDLLGKKFEIVGIADGANMFLFQFSFINQQEAINLLKLGNLTNFFLVKVQSGQIETVRTEINKIDGVEANTRTEFVTKNRKVIDEVFIPIIQVLIGISILVGTAVIGLTIYTSTIEKSREFGVVKALGASNWQIYRIIFEQSLISGVIGYFVGVGFTYLALWAIPNFVAVFITVTRVEDLLLVFFIALFMSVVASYMPVRRIVSIDPALVFKS